MPTATRASKRLQAANAASSERDKKAKTNGETKRSRQSSSPVAQKRRRTRSPDPVNASRSPKTKRMSYISGLLLRPSPTSQNGFDSEGIKQNHVMRRWPDVRLEAYWQTSCQRVVPPRHTRCTHYDSHVRLGGLKHRLMKL